VRDRIGSQHERIGAAGVYNGQQSLRLDGLEMSQMLPASKGDMRIS